jgi:6-phosphogluconolactonase/glucosamine-6-phosphate isomerase/deaminase
MSRITINDEVSEEIIQQIKKSLIDDAMNNMFKIHHFHTKEKDEKEARRKMGIACKKYGCDTKDILLIPEYINGVHTGFLSPHTYKNKRKINESSITFDIIFPQTHE